MNDWLPFEDPKYSQVRYDVWLMPWIRDRIARNQDVLGIFVGPRGTGKSYGALELSYTCDSTVTEDRVFFNIVPFIDEIVDGSLRKGNALILDDAGVFLNSRDWQSATNKAVSVVTQSFRYRNLITFITVPEWNFIDAQTRRLVNIFFEATKEQGVFKIKLPEPNPIKRGEYMMKYPRIYPLNKSQRPHEVPVKTVKFGLPPRWLIDRYEAKRGLEIRAMQKKVQRELHELLESEPGEKKRRVNPNSLRNLKRGNEKPTRS